LKSNFEEEIEMAAAENVKVAVRVRPFISFYFKEIFLISLMHLFLVFVESKL
jgi:hypothetical protein